jgi:signal peptidase II
MSLGGPGTSRLVFGLFACIALFALWRIYKGSKPENRLRVIAVALAWGGAAGNLLDRIIRERGVVDFLDIGVGAVRFWTFNVADSSISIGAVLLAVVLWKEDAEIKRAEVRTRESEAPAGRDAGVTDAIPQRIGPPPSSG